MKKIILSTILGLGFLTSCTSSKVVNENEEVLTIAPETRECSAGAAKMQCMLIKNDDSSDWQLFYNHIDGFNHEPGYEYKIVVSKSKIENAPADASTLKYKLIKVVSKKLATME
ncbi:DUF4377 domain-containing protein [Empedobacter brevis]|uniref:DUF4377 domain-containing protein n=1 Tax=Empedobacter brevis TaxID=247 RepID=UPI0039B04995